MLFKTALLYLNLSEKNAWDPYQKILYETKQPSFVASSRSFSSEDNIVAQILVFASSYDFCDTGFCKYIILQNVCKSIRQTPMHVIAKTAHLLISGIFNFLPMIPKKINSYMLFEMLSSIHRLIFLLFLLVVYTFYTQNVFSKFDRSEELTFFAFCYFLLSIYLFPWNLFSWLFPRLHFLTDSITENNIKKTQSSNKNIQNSVKRWSIKKGMKYRYRNDRTRGSLVPIKIAKSRFSSHKV